MFDPIKFIEEFLDIKLMWYQKILLRILDYLPVNCVFLSRHNYHCLKGGVVNGKSMRCNYGYGKISKCHYVDELPQRR